MIPVTPAGTTPVLQATNWQAELLASQHYDIGGLRSKSWSEFAQAGAPAMDLINVTLVNPVH